MRNAGRTIEVFANIAIVLVAALIVGIVYEQHHFGRGSNRAVIAVGASVPLKGIDWAATSSTLVMGMSTQCHFCTDSAPFYKDLVSRVSPEKVHLLAILPQSPNESRRYLNNLGVNISDVRQVSLPTIPISGTPTLLLVNGKGKVTRTWQGKLSPTQQTEVFESIGCNKIGQCS